MAELRVEIPDDIIAVMDASGHASGRSRKDITEEVLGIWAAQKKHESIVICRVAGINPLDKEANRRVSDK